MTTHHTNPTGCRYTIERHPHGQWEDCDTCDEPIYPEEARYVTYAPSDTDEPDDYAVTCTPTCAHHFARRF